MQILERNMNAVETDALSEIYFAECQASFNSDGKITLRNFNSHDKNKDEIIVLSHAETDALFKLFSRISSKQKNYDLPF